MRHLRVTSLPLVMACGLALAACDAPTALDSADPLFRHGGDHMVPIAAEYAYALIEPVVSIPCVGSDFVAPNLSGTGSASHLGTGEMVWVASSCVVVSTILTVEGTLTMTGANGDAVFSEWVLVFDLTTIGPDGKGPYTGAGEVIGGTGRFEGASGSYSGGGTHSYITASGTFSFEGMITSVGSLMQ